MRKTLGLGAVVLVAGLAPAAANATTFSGTCDDITGKATFTKPLTSEKMPNHYEFKGTAHCSGIVDGKKLPDRSPVHVSVGGDGALGCVSGEGKDGKGTITLDATGQKVGFLMDFTSTASEVDITLRGAKGGSGTGSASFFNESDPMANLTTVANCGSGGNKELSFTAEANVPESSKLDDGQTAGSGAATQPAPSPSSSGAQENAPTTGSSQSGQQPATQQSQPAQQSEPKAKAKAKKKSKKKNNRKKPKKSKKTGKKKGKRH